MNVLRGGLVVAALALGYPLLGHAVVLEDRVSPDLPVDAGLFVAEYGPEGTYFLHYRHHESVVVTVPVHNDGPLPVEVDRVTLSDPDGYTLLVPVGAPDPVTVAPFGSADVPVEVRFDNCRYWHERGARTVTDVHVHGTVLGRSFEETVALSHPLAVHAQVILDCPDRTLVRGDDRRE